MSTIIWSTAWAASSSLLVLCFMAAATLVAVLMYSLALMPAVLYACSAFFSASSCACISSSYFPLASSVVWPTAWAYSSRLWPPAPNNVSMPPTFCSKAAVDSSAALLMSTKALTACLPISMNAVPILASIWPMATDTAPLTTPSLLVIVLSVWPTSRSSLLLSSST